MSDTAPRPAPQDRHEDEPIGTTNLRLVRIRLALALLAVAIIPVAVILPVFRYASDDGRHRQETTADAVAMASRLSRILEEDGRSLVAGATAADAMSSKGPVALSTAFRSELAALADDPHVAAVAAADVAARSLFASPAATRIAPDRVRSLIALPVGSLLAVPSEDPSTTVTIGTPIAPGGGKPVGAVTLTVPLGVATQGGAAVDGRAIALLAADGHVVASEATGSGSLIGGRLLDVATEIGSGSETTVAVPLLAAGFEGWSLAVSDPVVVTAVPLPAVGLLAGLSVLLVVLATWMARQVLAPAVRLEESRRRLGDLYETARDAARLDSLTGLGNHRAFQEELDRQVESAKRYHLPLALLLLDLDEFKPVNDNLGHAVGDDLLIEMGELIRSVKRTPDTGFRTGGDEFALVLPHTDADGAEEVGRRLLSRCLEDRSTGHYRRPISFSGGVTAYPAGGTSRVQLYAQADAALYRSKRAGRTTISRFDADRDRELIDEHMRAELRSRLAAVIEGRKLTAVYQAIYHLGANRMLGVEGLVRPGVGSGFNGAGGLFEAAHVTGQIVELDRAALDVVTGGLGALPPEMLLSINLSPRSFESEDFSAAALLRILARHAIDPNRVIVELTEREQITDIDRVHAAVEACRAAGMRIAADDVGAGNAGLRLLSQIQFDVVKIDLSLVQANARREPVTSVVSSLVDLASRWGALTIAEGIETAGQLEAVRNLGVDAAQGFLLGRPGTIAEAIAQDVPPASVARTVDFAAAVETRRRLARAAG
ncbi:MAG TPA: bifunctional diguanylate cyclase/phosphodiesterase [Candidatus Limnocylindrales bacterium]|nr:bifunctional diguanylate cyclase/phosphodiesterase [Candidatus Limnocylindrales bacterium]